MKNRIFMLVPQVFDIADKLGIYSDDQTNMIEEYYLTSMKMVADMEGASKDSLEAAANQIKEESFDAIGRLAGFNLVYHLTGKNRLSIDQEGAETALPAAGVVAGAAAGAAAAAAASGASETTSDNNGNSASGDYNEMYDTLSDDQKQFLDNIDKLDYSEEKKEGMRYAAACLMAQGYAKEFVAGVLANIACEGEPGRFESSAYISHPEKEPAYLKALDEHHNYRDTMSGRSVSEVGIAETRAYLDEINAHDNEYDTTYYVYDEDSGQYVAKSTKPDLRFGIGMAQWTDDGRAGSLIDLYDQMCDTNHPSTSECARVEGTYMAYELTGHDGVPDHSSVYQEWKAAYDKGQASVYEAGYNVCANYEIPKDTATASTNRGNIAVDIYNTLTS